MDFLDKFIGFVAYALVRSSGKNISYREFKNRCCNPQERLIGNEIKKKIFQFIDDDKIKFLIRKNESMLARRHSLDKKAGNLLTLTSILIGLLAAFSAIKPPGILFIIPFVLLFINIFVLTIYFNVNTHQYIDYEYLFSNASLKSTRAQLATDYYLSQDYNQRVTNFLVDIYEASLRYFTLSILFILILGIISVSTARNSNLTWETIKTIKNDQDLVNYLRGPQGPQGSQGPRGLQGLGCDTK